MGKRQALGLKKHHQVNNRVYVHMTGRGMAYDFVEASWAQGGNEYWFRTREGRRGWWNPKTDELRFLPPTQELAQLLYEGASMTCPGGRTASLCECQIFGLTEECQAIAKAALR